jgi:hypothetical protein
MAVVYEGHPHENLPKELEEEDRVVASTMT